MTYERQIATAKRLIQKFGRSCTIVTVTEGTADATKPWRGGTATQSSESSYGVMLDYKAEHIDGTRIQQGDKKVFVQQTTTPPKPQGLVKFDSDVWKIVNVETLAPNGTPIMYVLQVRQ
jgi:hypothetical protein